MLNRRQRFADGDGVGHVLTTKRYLDGSDWVIVLELRRLGFPFGRRVARKELRKSLSWPKPLLNLLVANSEIEFLESYGIAVSLGEIDTVG